MVADGAAFHDIWMPWRPDKPRSEGVSMMIDWGMGLAHQRDTLESAGDYIDFAKIAATIGRVMPRRLLSAKLALYKEHAISTSPGGLLVELALAAGTYTTLVEQACELGFSGIEISDNLLDLQAVDKKQAIRRAKAAGLVVFGEVGKKQGKMGDEEIIQDVANCLESGADWVFIEADEVVPSSGARWDLIAVLHERFPANRVIFELPVELLPSVTRTYKHQITVSLVKELGTNVGLANIEWDELYVTELVRRGSCGDTTHPCGAYRHAGIA